MSRSVLLLTGEPPENPGGVEHVIRELSKGLTSRGYNVEVLHRGNSSPAWVARPRNKWQAYPADVMLGWCLGRKAKERMGTDVVAVVSNGFFGWHLPIAPFSAKRIHIYHGTYRGMSDAIRPYISKLGALKLKWWDSMVLERWSGRGKQVICNSDQTKAEVLQYFGHGGTTMWLPMDTNHFRPLDKVAARQELSLPPLGRIGMFAGSTQPAKGFSVVRSLMEMLPDVQWILALRGEAPATLETDKRVFLFKDARPEALPTLYSAADFTVSPSLYEPFGYVVAEALSCGTPVVAARGGASCRFLAHETVRSFLIPSAVAVEEFARGIREILRDPDFYRKSVIDYVRPEIENVMSTSLWLDNFCTLTGL